MISSERCVWMCSKCHATPLFTHREYWGFNMADARCPNGCVSSFEVNPTEIKKEEGK